MPIEKKPVSATFPPKTGISYKVRSGDTWGTIAVANGISVLDLIMFNFGFSPSKKIDPAEVNWCLRSWVGCKRTTFDKKNWIFSDDANPGLIFVPSKSTPPAKPLLPTATVVPALLAEEDDVTAGSLRVNDAYDLKLKRLSTGDYELLCFMKLQFFFENSSGVAWTDKEKSKFIKDWEVAIKSAWSGRIIKTLPVSKKKVFLRFDFSIQEGGWMFDHWEITVTKIKAGSFRTSSVRSRLGNVTLDSEDLTPVTKAPGSGCKQRGAVHEFGHMLGIDDEYLKSSPHVGDTQSIMHSCEVVSMRHNEGFVKWLNEQIAGLGLN